VSAAVEKSGIALARSRVADQIFDDLKRQIITGALPRGAKLQTERELAERYRVSAPTVREAIRGLSLGGLIEVRHGSGAYVTADSESLIAMSLSAVIQLETVGVADTLSILSVLNCHAAGCAARLATPSDLQRLKDATEALIDVQSAQRAESGVRAFHHALVKAAHNPLLEVICGFLANVQVAFAMEITGGSLESWREILTGLKDVRARFVEAIERRDVKAATTIALEFHTEAMRLITSLPRAQHVRMSDPQLAILLSSIVNGMRRTPSNEA
jgi:GntR family transcriptional repressor for pyruvate dehydrogenase complex